MNAALYTAFDRPLRLETVPDPTPPRGGALLRVGATGLCRSDWHGWKGHDPGIQLPHVPGHELAGEVVAVGGDVRQWRPGDQVTAPFVNGCGQCPDCLAGQAQVCPHQRQPGFTHWGSFAEYVVIEAADFNLVRVPATMSLEEAASLGCRFATAYRGLIVQGGLRAGQWVAIHGCGGLGLSAVMIAAAAGARVLAVDVVPAQLRLARELGAETVVDASSTPDVTGTIVELSRGGVHVSVDAVGHPTACVRSILALRRQGIHVQLGLLLGTQSRPPIPMDRVVAWELRLVGGHGMAARAYGEMFAFLDRHGLRPGRLVTRRVSLARGAELLTQMDRHPAEGITLITRFDRA